MCSNALNAHSLQAQTAVYWPINTMPSNAFIPFLYVLLTNLAEWYLS